MPRRTPSPAIDQHAVDGGAIDFPTVSADQVRDAFESGRYPYAKKMGRRVYEQEKAKLQAELLKVQLWAQESEQKLIFLFEGRDAAGKGGTIKRFTEHLNPRFARVVALNKSTNIEKSQWYFQRYLTHLPSGGEMVFYDRSWYNRAGVERVMVARRKMMGTWWCFAGIKPIVNSSFKSLTPVTFLKARSRALRCQCAFLQASTPAGLTKTRFKQPSVDSLGSHFKVTSVLIGASAH